MGIVVGVDSGGSRTRALAVALDGKPLGYGESGGGNATHDAAARANVREAIARAVEGCGVGSVARVVAGVAGMSGGEDWAHEVTDVPGLTAACERLNDADVGHYAAFGRGPGILSVQGTGSTVFAVLESGERVRNAAFGHYACGGAVWLGQSGLHAVLAGSAPGLAGAACEVLGARDLGALRRRVREGWSEAKAKSAALGTFARRVTAAAERGEPDARRLCQRAAGEIVEGIRLLGHLFEGEEVPVAFVGACVRSAAVRREVEAGLTAAGEKRYAVVEPQMPPVVGAALMALEGEGVGLDEGAVRRLSEFAEGLFAVDHAEDRAGAL